MEGDRSSPADDVVVKPAAAVMHSNRQKSRTPARSRPSFSLRMWATHFALDGADALLCRLSSNGPRAFNSNDNHLPSGALKFRFAALTSLQHRSRLQLRSLASTAAASSSSASTMTRWMRPEVWSPSVLGLCGFLGIVIVPCASSSSSSSCSAYPLFAAVGFAVWMCCFQLVRNVYTNPDVRVNKAGKTSGVINNHEGHRYAEHGIRKFLRNRNLQSSQQ
ncbi:hypothetical protein C4D60_Mb04t10960 [Musa balbisiana]|uniref:Uncharacterized protein n=1 Tax=Musa balbisiana TaxID=52838 RepID=A0A4S8KB53_MUSBA|nr:hypothetical protein C4D60_Mb04t10960 [Musa balbisiana]